jgi:hypothetical protein
MIKLDKGLSAKRLRDWIGVYVYFNFIYTKILNHDIKVLKPTFKYYFILHILYCIHTVACFMSYCKQ